MDTCPVCQQDASIGWYKATMSPLAPMPCSNCDIDLSVTWKAYLLSALPGSFLFLLGYLLLEDESIAQYASYAGSIIFIALTQRFYMPIIVVTKDKEKKGA
jgi:hypothetical protein